jgi:ABC-type branched-subunit amino acid transport system substrate-binding protein
MTRRRTPAVADPLTAFAPVAEAYRRRFRREVWTWRMDWDRLPALAAAMQAAMQAGEPLSCDEATSITGVSPPPLGADG